MVSNSISKTKLLSEKELDSLRTRVQKRFLDNDPTRQPVPHNTFLGSYEALRGDILRNMPDAEPSVSLTRLRKLFHYTDPTVCSPERLERASFGKDFLDALERYMAKSEVPISFQGQKKWWDLVALLVVLTTATTALFFYPFAPKAWQEDFQDVTTKGLGERGWRFLNYDSIWFHQQLRRDNMLTLWTLPGDYWVKEGEKRQIINMLIHKVEGDCFSVRTKICNFSPRQNSQQIALYLFDEQLNPQNWIRLSFEYWKKDTDTKGNLQITRTYSEDGDITVLENGFSGRETDTIRNMTQSIWFMLQVKNKMVRTSRRINFEWEPIGGFTTPVFINFKPAYIGIGACQGWTFDDGTPKNADTIPAFIDYLIFEPLDANE